MFRYAEPKPLTQSNLSDHAPALRVPTYDRAALGTSVVHIGVGGFHRAHQAAYLDDIAEGGVSDRWGVTGICMRRPAMAEALAPQDHLYTLVERSHRGERPRVVGSVKRCLYAPENPAAAVLALSDPGTRLVTLTITGDGYTPADEESPHRARTFNYICRALEERLRRRVRPFTVLSCDNLPGNGDVAREATIRAASSPRLAKWIERKVAFPSSVVDRITPETTDETRELVAREFGVADRAPVTTEPFSMWVIEDTFSNERPPLDAVGAEFVDDVEAFARAKRRMLNGGHSALGYIGYLLGHRTTDQAMADPRVATYLDRLLADEIAPILEEPRGFALDDFRATLLERFANPRLGDRLARLCGRGSTKMPAYLLPSLAEARAEGRRIDLLALAVAAWFIYLRGYDLDGRLIRVVDPCAAEIQPLARASTEDPRVLLGVDRIFGDLGSDPGVVGAIEDALESIRTDGLGATVWRYAQAGTATVAA